MGQGGSKKGAGGKLPKTGPASQKGALVFRVRESDYNLEGFLVVANDTIHFQPKASSAIKSFSLKHLRSYGQQDGVFSFKTGRAASEPEKLFRYTVVDGSDIHAALKRHVTRVKSTRDMQKSTSGSSLPRPLPATPSSASSGYEQPGMHPAPDYAQPTDLQQQPQYVQPDPARQQPDDYFDTDGANHAEYARANYSAQDTTYDSLDQTTRTTAPARRHQQQQQQRGGGQPVYSHLQHEGGPEQVYSSLDHSTQQTTFHSTAGGIYKELNRSEQTYNSLEGTHMRAPTSAENPHFYDRLN